MPSKGLVGHGPEPNTSTATKLLLFSDGPAPDQYTGGLKLLCTSERIDVIWVLTFRTYRQAQSSYKYTLGVGQSQTIMLEILDYSEG